MLKNTLGWTPITKEGESVRLIFFFLSDLGSKPDKTVDINRCTQRHRLHVYLVDWCIANVLKSATPDQLAMNSLSVMKQDPMHAKSKQVTRE